MTDADWPQVMRVSPILDWSYQDIWMFLRELNVPYCCLYDQGYSSIGSYHNTAPNPRLMYKDDNGEIKYHPAYLLKDEKSERSGRN
ncbi:Molybdopterin-binding protein [Gryllus bimaculatus]|nr:Molybdopterin-binding protein [Gryllus bimaculatus]